MTETATVSVCPKCRAELRGDGQFCHRCGRAVKGAAHKTARVCNGCDKPLTAGQPAHTHLGRAYCSTCLKSFVKGRKSGWVGAAFGLAAFSFCGIYLLLYVQARKETAALRAKVAELRPESEEVSLSRRIARALDEEIRATNDATAGSPGGRDVLAEAAALARSAPATGTQPTRDPMQRAMEIVAGAPANRAASPSDVEAARVIGGPLPDWIGKPDSAKSSAGVNPVRVHEDKDGWKKRENWQRLQAGMTEDEVTAILGPPTGRKEYILTTEVRYGAFNTVTYDKETKRVTGWHWSGPTE